MKLRLSREILLGLMALLLPAMLALKPGKQAIEPLDSKTSEMSHEA